MNRSELSILLDEFTAGMTSIRGRRVKRLILREYDEMDTATIRADANYQAIVGENVLFEKICKSDGKGKYAIIEIVNKKLKTKEQHKYDLLHDSLKRID